MQFKRIAVDTSKATFTVHGVYADDRPTLKQNLSRVQFEVFCRKLAPTESRRVVVPIIGVAFSKVLVMWCG